MEKGERKETRREEMGEGIGERGEVKERERESLGWGTEREERARRRGKCKVCLKNTLALHARGGTRPGPLPEGPDGDNNREGPRELQSSHFAQA